MPVIKHVFLSPEFLILPILWGRHNKNNKIAIGTNAKYVFLNGTSSAYYHLIEVSKIRKTVYIVYFYSLHLNSYPHKPPLL